ncbi:histone-lysine N-methyltransferase SETDB1-B-like [Trachinotus anak]|uniref:histone-lysine N-methyltransferase SETDB1-B-like n=1 Tax=Trachinotus anak TaxID=443729 RepID=UPI0039F1EB12
MEGDEIEMSKEELQKWIREKVKKNHLISPDVIKKCHLLQSLLERREKQAVQLLKLCESVAACEAIVKEQYSLLGWEYKDTDSDDADSDISDCGHTPPPPCESVRSETEVCHSPATNDCTPQLPKLQDMKNLNRDNGRKSSHTPMREAVVVLTRLPASKISALHPPTSSDNLDSDIQWEPEDDSRGSDFSPSSFESGSNKRRKIDRMSSHATPKASTSSNAKSSAVKTPAPRPNRNTNTEETKTKTSTPPVNTNGVTPVCIVTATKTPPSVPRGELSVNMKVLARRRAMRWQRGKIVEILTKEDGRLKYKISFEEKGKSLVSGHHIAFDSMPEVEHLFVGARVVVKCKADRTRFCPGVLAELPNRKNRMRFLVFTDDHTPVYAGLSFLHMVCKPLTDPLDDIPYETHKNFMKKYLKSWPYLPQTQYKVGQLISAECDGVQKKCEVKVVDGSLIQVVFQEDQHKKWIHRGSIRLEHMINMRAHMIKSTSGNYRSKS